MALRNNYKLRPNSRALGLAGSVMTIVLSINGCSHPQGSRIYLSRGVLGGGHASYFSTIGLGKQII